MKYLCCLLTLFLIYSSAQAGPIQWTFSGNGTWAVASNWSTGNIPAPGDDVTLDIDGATIRTIIHSSGVTNINTLSSEENFILSGGEMSVASTAIINQTFTISGGELKNTTLGTVSNRANVVASTSTSSRFNNVTLHGDVDMAGSGSRTLKVSGGFNLDGTASLDSSDRITFDGDNAQSLTAGTFSLNNSTFSVDGSTNLTLESGVTVQGSGTLGISLFNNTGTAQLTNRGLIKSDTSSLTITSEVFSNEGTLQIDSGKTITLQDDWSNQSGNIVLNEGTLNLQGSFGVVDLNQDSGFQRSGGTVNLQTSLAMASNENLNIGDVVVSGGQITGGTVNGNLTISNSTDNRLTDVTVNGNMDLTGSSSRTLKVSGDLELNGTASLDSSDRITFDGNNAQSVTAGTFVLSNSALFAVDGSTHLTLENGVTIQGTGTVGLSLFNNSGTAQLTNRGLIKSDTSFLTISSEVFNNEGTLQIDSGNTMTLQDDWSSQNGNIVLNEGTLNLQGSFGVVDLNQDSGFQRSGGTVNLQTSLTMASNENLSIGDVVVSGGQITGGTVNGNLTISNSTDNRLTDVTVNGNMDLAGSSSRTLKVSNGLELNGTASLDSSDRITFDGNNAQSVTAGTFVLSNSALFAVDGSTHLTLENGVTIQGTGTVGLSLFDNSGTAQLTNRGLIKSDTSFLTISSEVFSNEGTLQIDSGKTMTLQDNWSSQNGNIVLNGGTLNLQGSFGVVDLNQDSGFQRSGGTVNLQTSLAMASNENLTIGDVVVSGGQISGGAVDGNLIFSTSSANRLDNLIVNGNLDLTGSSSRTTKVSNGLHLNGIANLDTSDRIAFDGNNSQSVTAGTFVLNGSQLAVDGSTNLTFGSAVTVQGTGTVGASIFDNTGTGVLINQGLIVSNVSNGTITINPEQFTNQGIVKLNNGGRITLGSAGLLNDTGGLVQGIGTINGNINNSQGIINPGNSPGQITLNGDFTQGNAGTLSIEIAGITQGVTFDYFEVLGDASLDGILQVELLDDFLPLVDQQFVIMTAEDGIFGEFSEFNFINSSWTVTYTANEVILNFQGLSGVIPEPGSIVLLLIAFFGFSFFRNRVG